MSVTGRNKQVQFQITEKSKVASVCDSEDPGDLDQDDTADFEGKRDNLGYSQTRENTFGASEDSIPLNDPEEQKNLDIEREHFCQHDNEAVE